MYHDLLKITACHSLVYKEDLAKNETRNTSYLFEIAGSNVDED